ncbi:MAG: protein translocase subunit SecF [Nannocystaceae bacterium]|nr:protein translocase subunit SecF [Nannocystaceae bacterium]
MQEGRQKFFEVIRPGTAYPFVAKRWSFIWGSIALIVFSAAMLVYNQFVHGAPLNWGIDFAGGSTVRLQLAKEVPVEDIRTALDGYGYEGAAAVTVPGAENEVLLRVKEVVSIDDTTLAACKSAVAEVPANASVAATAPAVAKQLGFHQPEGGSKIFIKYDAEPDWAVLEQRINAAGCHGTVEKGFEVREGEVPVEVSLIGMGNKLRDQLDQRFGAGTVAKIVQAETVGAKVGNQLKADGAKSLLYAMGFIFLYVMIRFDLRFAPGGIVALAHDAFITIGAFALTWKEFSLTTIAAILTIVGYSINDTIVVFDRVRERVALFRDEDIEETTNRALNETLSRTLLTSGTTLLSVVAVYVMGSGSIADFSFALIVGITVGTYSSLFIATPVFLWVNRRFYAGKGHLRWRNDGPVGETPAGSERPVLAAEEGEIDEAGRTAGEVRQAERAQAGDDDDEGDGETAAPGEDRIEVEAPARPARSTAPDGEPGDEGPAPKASRRRRRPQS